ncbi:armadillo-type protein [Gongronella butleri]|nr:armadillo-type protein [Gongronella butleri]
MAEWTPNQDSLLQLLELLMQAAEPEQGQSQEWIFKRLESFHRIGEYPLYLVHILTQLQQHGTIRSVAGMVLKNLVLDYQVPMHPSVQSIVKQQCRLAVIHPDPDPIVRNAVELVITALMRRGGVRAWYDILVLLTDQLQHTSQIHVEMALRTLCTVCEDCTTELDHPHLIDLILPRLIAFFDHPDTRLQVKSLAAANQFILISSQSLPKCVDQYLQSILRRMRPQEDPAIRQEVCRTLVLLAEKQPEVIAPYGRELVQYMLLCLQDPEDYVAIEACTFWQPCLDATALQQYVVDVIPQLVPLLLDHMVLSEEDELMLMPSSSIDDDQASTPPSSLPLSLMPGCSSNDRQSPPSPSPTQRAVAATPGAPIVENANYGSAPPSPTPMQDAPSLSPPTRMEDARLAPDDDDDDNAMSDDDSELDDDEDDDMLASMDDDDDDMDQDPIPENEEFYSEWTRRKRSATSFECLMSEYPEQVVYALFTVLSSRLNSENWKLRESGILALGTINPDCISTMAPHLPGVIPYLLQSTTDLNPCVRATACWTLSRYSKWTVPQFFTEKGRDMVYKPVLDSVLRSLLDTDKQVQTTASAALTTFIEESSVVALTPYLPEILAKMNAAFSMYGERNTNLLLDSLGSLSESVGHALQQPGVKELVMLPLVSRWNALADNDPNWFPLFSCLCSVTAALGNAFEPYAELVFLRCLYFINTTLRVYLMTNEVMDLEFLVGALQVLSGLVQGLGTNIRPLVARSTLLKMLDVCVRDQESEVVTWTCALIGDLATACFDTLAPSVPSFLEGLIDQMDATAYHSNNAIWCVGEIALRWGNAIEPFIPPLLDRMIPILHPQTAYDGIRPDMQKNTIIALGRLGSACPTVMAARLPEFIGPWLDKAVREHDYDQAEKDSAFVGLCDMIRVNPEAGLQHLDIIVMAISQQVPTPSLKEQFQAILNLYRAMVPPVDWSAIFERLPLSSQHIMSTHYVYL